MRGRLASTSNSLVTIFDINLFSSSEWINNAWFAGVNEKIFKVNQFNPSSRLFCSSSRKLLRHFLILTFFALTIFSVITFARLLGLLVSISCLAFLVATSFDCSMISLLNALHASSDLSMVASNVWAPSSITL